MIWIFKKYSSFFKKRKMFQCQLTLQLRLRFPFCLPNLLLLMVMPPFAFWCIMAPAMSTFSRVTMAAEPNITSDSGIND